MRNILNTTRLLLAGALALVASGACASHSHKSVRTYDYREDDGSDERTDRAQQPSELTSEYQMVSPGEMQSPGKPVVDPR